MFFQICSNKGKRIIEGVVKRLESDSAVGPTDPSRALIASSLVEKTLFSLVLTTTVMELAVFGAAF